MKKLFKWVLYITTAISIFMSIFSLVADQTETKSYDPEIGEQVLISTSQCPCWELAIPFIIVSTIGMALIIKIQLNHKKK